VALVSLPAATIAYGQPPPPSARGEAGLALRVFTIRYKNIDDVYLRVSPSLGPRGSIRAQPHQRTLTVLDEPANLEHIAELIAAYDVPPRAVEVSVQLIMAQAGGDAVEPPPPPIRGVIEKLNALSTRWNDYRMLGSARVMGTEGEHSTLRVGDDYRVDFRIDEVADESRIIRFKPFELQRRELTVEGNERYTPVMSTVLNLRDAQLFIVGASKMERSNRALFMTVTASLQAR
ncbi:MAG TPA: secretin N-terminal domain-containing protein, partial [Candidatus Polarisedimenticolia bacterium]|nr:secretin N-terminal domain-containing protein [Candidatus Polarisedimenticolia bacterium]